MWGIGVGDRCVVEQVWCGAEAALSGVWGIYGGRAGVGPRCGADVGMGQAGVGRHGGWCKARGAPSVSCRWGVGQKCGQGRCGGQAWGLVQGRSYSLCDLQVEPEAMGAPDIPLLAPRCPAASIPQPILTLSPCTVYPLPHQAERVSQLVMLTGIITAAAKPKARVRGCGSGQ